MLQLALTLVGNQQVTLQQENARLKEIFANGILKGHKGSDKFNEMLSNKRRHHCNEDVGFMRQYKSNGEPWDLEQYPKTHFVAQMRRSDPLTFEGTSGKNDHAPSDFNPMYALTKDQDGQPIAKFMGPS